ncbi:MAG: hypothetical protein WB559_04945 [Candidatus Acidiferrales bacterium]
MKYQLILQFAAESVRDFDRLVNLEKKLMQELVSVGEVDGHDFGQSEFNIFVLTDEPAPAFEKARGCIEKQALPYDWRAAYRELTSDAYAILWPPGLNEFNVA